MRIATVILCTFILMSTSWCGPGPDLRKERVVFVFCDVTFSLNGTERTQVARMAANILNHLPAGTAYRVYPIQAETAALAPINEKELRIPERNKNAGLQAVRDEQRQDELIAELERYSKEMNSTPDGRERRDDNRTCIVNALGFAANQLKQFPAEKYDRELVIISDMLEECNDTPLGRRVNIKQPDITQELKLANNFPEGNDLSAVKITIITPVTLETYVKHAPGKEPSMAALKEFWAVVFSRYKVTREAQQESGVYSWSHGEVPGSLLAQAQ